MKRVSILCALILVLAVQNIYPQAPEMINYQGILSKSDGTYVNDGPYKITFSIYDNETSVAALWTETHNSVPVIKGIFNIILGSLNPLTMAQVPFDKQYWLGIRINEGAELMPRLPLTSAAYSLNARSVSDGAITTDKLDDNAVTTAKIQPDIVSSVDGVTNDGGNIDLVPGPNITIAGDDAANTITIGATDVWKLTGNAGTDPTTDFLGTTDNKALELRVNNVRALGLIPDATSPNIIGGFIDNTVWFDTHGATISGGGYSGHRNVVTDHYGTIGGGFGNTAGNNDEITNNNANATVSGGVSNTASGQSSTIGGGVGNKSELSHATVGGGYYNIAGGSNATVGGGYENKASAHQSTVSGGVSNVAIGEYAFIGGGHQNQAQGNHSAIGGGRDNTASGIFATVPGGEGNTVLGHYGFAAGRNAKVYHQGAFIFTDSLSSNFASLYNNELAVRCTGGARFITQVDPSNGNVVNGVYFKESSQMMRITNTGDALLVLEADTDNYNEQDNAGILFKQDGGLAQGYLGYRDGTNYLSLENRYPDKLELKSSGGIYLYTNDARSTGMYIGAGGSGWNVVSDRNMKGNIREVNTKDVLNRLSGIPISQWSYNTQDPSIEHIGPMAQDFHEAFGLGEDKKSINSIDTDGVALAAIQGLYEIVKEKDEKIATQQEQINALESRLAALEKLISSDVQGVDGK